MGTAATLLAWLLDEAFSGGGLDPSNGGQSLMANLASVTDDQWHARLPGSRRSIESMALHVGACKLMYANHAFEDASLTWESPEVARWTLGTAPRQDAGAWIRAQHARLVAHVRGLSDTDLTTLRAAHWGEQRETRWLLSTLLQHDAYHAGEINHLRALLAGEDRWQWHISLGIDPDAGPA